MQNSIVIGKIPQNSNYFFVNIAHPYHLTVKYNISLIVIWLLKLMSAHSEYLQYVSTSLIS